MALRRNIKYLPGWFVTSLRALRHMFRIVGNYGYDALRFLKYSCMLRPASDPDFVCTEMMLRIHSIERGLSLKEVRLGFGKEKINELLTLVEQHCGKLHSSDLPSMALSVLNVYVSYHEKRGHDVSSLKSRVTDLEKKYSMVTPDRIPGVIELTKEEVLAAAKADFDIFSAKRYSIRNFSDEDVDVEVLKKAVGIAMKAPSVCNRQAARVYIVSDKMILNEILGMRNGIGGCEDVIKKIIIVATELSAFVGINERNQSFVDGGIFLMALLYGLHYCGLAACPLNWAVDRKADRRLRSVIGIRPSNNIIAMVSVGNLPDSFAVAKSVRKNVNDVTVVV